MQFKDAQRLNVTLVLAARSIGFRPASRRPGRVFAVRFLNRSSGRCPRLRSSCWRLAGCGGDGDGGSGAPADDPEIVAAVTEKIERAARPRSRTRPATATCRARTQFKTVCLPPEEAAKFGTPREAVQCHVEAFTLATAGRQAGLCRGARTGGCRCRTASSGEPEIVGEYRIRNFLRKDHRLDCSGGETPPERCTGEFRPPPEASGSRRAQVRPAGSPDPAVRPASALDAADAVGHRARGERRARHRPPAADHHPAAVPVGGAVPVLVVLVADHQVVVGAARRRCSPGCSRRSRACRGRGARPPGSYAPIHE